MRALLNQLLGLFVLRVDIEQLPEWRASLATERHEKTGLSFVGEV
jgi:hypothetical protein